MLTPECVHVQIKERTAELAELESLDNGKPIAEAEGDMVRLWLSYTMHTLARC